MAALNQSPSSWWGCHPRKINAIPDQYYVIISYKNVNNCPFPNKNDALISVGKMFKTIKYISIKSKWSLKTPSSICIFLLWRHCYEDDHFIFVPFQIGKQITSWISVTKYVGEYRSISNDPLSIGRLGISLGENFLPNFNIFIKDDAFEDAVCEMSAIFSRGKWVNTLGARWTVRFLRPFWKSLSNKGKRFCY